MHGKKGWTQSGRCELPNCVHSMKEIRDQGLGLVLLCYISGMETPHPIQLDNLHSVILRVEDLRCIGRIAASDTRTRRTARRDWDLRGSTAITSFHPLDFLHNEKSRSSALLPQETVYVAST